MEDGFICVICGSSSARQLRRPPGKQVTFSVTPAAGRAPGQPPRRQRSSRDLLLWR